MANQLAIHSTKVSIGDLINVSQAVKEDDKDRTLAFDGRVISIRGRAPNQTFMVRKLGLMNIGVEKIFPVNLPSITKIEVKKSIPSKKAKLYSLRNKK